MWQHPTEHSALGVLGVILGTVVALWLATTIAARMSYRMVHSSSEQEPKMREVFTLASGLLAPAAAPAFFVLFALPGFISIKVALSIGVLSLVLSLFFFSLYAGRKSTDGLSKILLYSVLQMALGVGGGAAKAGGRVGEICALCGYSLLRYCVSTIVRYCS